MPRNLPVKLLGNSPSKESGNSPALPKNSGNAAAASSSGTFPSFQKKSDNTHTPTKKSRNATASVSRSAVITSNDADNANKGKAISKKFYNNSQESTEHDHDSHISRSARPRYSRGRSNHNG
ncbi:25445_t:CDS:2, partial [Gigaspora rosea]